MVGAALVACSGASKGTPSDAGVGSAEAGAMVSPGTAASLPVCTDAGLAIAFNPMYSAFIDDGMHTFQIPAIVVGSNQSVTWIADGTMVGMQADMERPNEVLITMLRAGNTTIAVQSMDGKCGSATLTISSATESDWQIGNARYNDGNSLRLQGGATGGTGSPLELMADGGGPACTNCHGETATNGPFTDVSHTPEQTGGFSDDEILNIVLHGTFPEGGYFDPTIAPYAAWQNFHRWADIQPDQQRGIITYLRSLTPAPQKGQVNFGAFALDASMGVAGDTDAGADDAGGD